MVEGASTFLIGVTEDAHPVERGIFDELAEVVEFRSGFAGIADDERGAQRDVGNGAAHLFDRSQEDVTATAAFHPFENGGRGVLQRDVDIGTDIVVGGDGFEQMSRDLVGISVEEADPLQTRDSGELFEQQSETVFEAEVFAVAGGVLSDQGNFANAG